MDLIDMSPNLLLVVAIGVLFTTGVYLLLERSLTRVLIGFILLGNGANLLFLVAGGRAGGAPLIGETDPADSGACRSTQSGPAPGGAAAARACLTRILYGCRPGAKARVTIFQMQNKNKNVT